MSRRYSGIPCITVVGHAKGIDIRPGQELQSKTFNHSWNVIFVDDSWQLLDCHWASRYAMFVYCYICLVKTKCQYKCITRINSTPMYMMVVMGKAAVKLVFVLLCTYTRYCTSICVLFRLMFQYLHRNIQSNVLMQQNCSVFMSKSTGLNGLYIYIVVHPWYRYLQSNDCNVPEDMKYEYDDFYFCPDPEALIYSHFPDDPKWQLLKQPLR